MTESRPNTPKTTLDSRLTEAGEILSKLGFRDRQQNDMARLVLLALCGVTPAAAWSDAKSVTIGITPIMDWIGEHYHVRYAPNTRETVRDEVVKHFVQAGLLIKNPDQPDRPTNSGKTVYSVESEALRLLRSFGSSRWSSRLRDYLSSRDRISDELNRARRAVRVAARLPDGRTVSLSSGGQNPPIKQVLENFCGYWIKTAVVVYIGDSENKWLHYDKEYLLRLGVSIDSSEKMPDVVVHDATRNWLVLIEAVATSGPVDGKRRIELKRIFAQSTAGLVFVTAFPNRDVMRSFVTQVSWETEVWLADDPQHLIHFNGERCFAPYPDATPESMK